MRALATSDLSARYAEPRTPVFAASVSAQHRATLAEILAQPRMALLASDLDVAVSDSLGVPFRVVGGQSVTFSSGTLCEMVARHAVELALWKRLAPEPPTPARELAAALLSCRVAAIDAQSQAHSPPEVAAIPAWLEQLYGLLATDPFPRNRILAGLMRTSPFLRQLAGAVEPPDPIEIDAVEDDVRTLLQQCVDLAAPVEFLLTTGGDSRVRVDPARGLNGYGCSPRPRPTAITFASCTATSISSPAFAHAEQVRQSLISAALNGDLERGFATHTQRVKDELLSVCECGDDTAVVLAASGTDAELGALHLALPSADDRLMNVVVGQGETGSSVGIAAAGRHFDSETALGISVPRGEHLEGLSADRVRVENVPVREDDGNLRDQAAVDQDVATAVSKGLAEGRRVLLHVLDTSKTGLLAPDLAVVTRARERHTDRVDVLVDASQLRLGRAVLREYLARGYLVLLTGSKFFTGPPFAGALLIPRGVAERACGAPWSVPGLSAYSTRWEWPAEWAEAQRQLPARRNIGLLLRWQAALWEMQAFHRVSPVRVKEILVRFGEVIRGAIACRPHLAAVPSRAIDRDGISSGEWDGCPTIFPFAVMRPNGSRMTLAELRNVYDWLNRDLSPWLPTPASSLPMAATCCHIGQPVLLAREGDGLAAMRIAGGARLASGVTFDPGLGATEEERLGREIHDALRVFEKIDLIVANYDRLAPLTAIA